VRAEERGGGRQQEDEAARGRQACKDARAALHPRRDRALECLEHRIEVPRAIVAHTIDEYRRRTGYPVAFAVVDVLLDASFELPIRNIFLELRHVEIDLSSEVPNDAVVKRRLTLIESVVHLPKAPLPGGGFCRARRELCSRMCAFVGKVAEDVSEALPER